MFLLLRLIFVISWLLPSALVVMNRQDQALDVTSVTAEQIEGSSEVAITYELNAQEGESPVTPAFYFRDRPRDEWQSIVVTFVEESPAPGSEGMVVWDPLKADIHVETRQAQIQMQAASAADEQSSILSTEFSLDTRPPIGCSCGYPGYEAEDISLDTSLVATIPRGDQSPPFHYRFRLGLGGESMPLAVGEWQDSTIWSTDLLEPDTSYWWQVKARDRFGNEAGWSPPVNFTTTTGEAGLETPQTGDSISALRLSPGRIFSVLVMVLGILTALIWFVIRGRRNA